jgi:hypothetical protein
MGLAFLETENKAEKRIADLAAMRNKRNSRS